MLIRVYLAVVDAIPVLVIGGLLVGLTLRDRRHAARGGER